jgi:3,4-dihydroxy 2-butanone 4-phosphate synthase/GTP cyclohydrolase II
MLTNIDEALKRIRRGEMVLVVDDEDRENEGDLQMAASWVTADALNFMLRWARGLICMPAAPTVIDALDLAPMVAPEVAGCDTPFTVPIDHVDGGSGISAADRALTIRRCVDVDATPGEFTRPGHVFPLRANAGGTLVRRGHTESAVDLAALAGLPPVAVTCEVLDDKGEAASFDVLVEFAHHHRIAMVSIDQIVEHRKANGVTGAAESRRPALLL